MVSNPVRGKSAEQHRRGRPQTARAHGKAPRRLRTRLSAQIFEKTRAFRVSQRKNATLGRLLSPSHVLSSLPRAVLNYTNTPLPDNVLPPSSLPQAAETSRLKLVSILTLLGR